MSIVWYVLVLCSTLGGLLYNASSKQAAESINPLLFSLILNLTATFCAVLSSSFGMLTFKTAIGSGLTTKGVVWAAAAGLGAFLYDLLYNCALRYGSPVTTHVTLAIAAVVVFALFSSFFFQEPMPPLKILGIVLGIAAVSLVVYASD